MNAAETGTLWGLIVALIPGYRIKLGKPTLNKRQKRPIAAFIFFWLVTILGFVGMPLFGCLLASEMSNQEQNNLRLQFPVSFLASCLLACWALSH